MTDRERRLEKALAKIAIWSGEAVMMDAPSPVRGLIDAIFQAADNGLGHMPTSVIRQIIDRPDKRDATPCDQGPTQSDDDRLFQLFSAAFAKCIAADDTYTDVHDKAANAMYAANVAMTVFEERQ